LTNFVALNATTNTQQMFDHLLLGKQVNTSDESTLANPQKIAI
jgi:hypothetical protein